MKNTKGVLPIVIIIALLIAGGFYVYSKRQSNRADNTASDAKVFLQMMQKELNVSYPITQMKLNSNVTIDNTAGRYMEVDGFVFYTDDNFDSVNVHQYFLSKNMPAYDYGDATFTGHTGYKGASIICQRFSSAVRTNGQKIEHGIFCADLAQVPPAPVNAFPQG